MRSNGKTRKMGEERAEEIMAKTSSVMDNTLTLPLYAFYPIYIGVCEHNSSLQDSSFSNLPSKLVFIILDQISFP